MRNDWMMTGLSLCGGGLFSAALTSLWGYRLEKKKLRWFRAAERRREEADKLNRVAEGMRESYFGVLLEMQYLRMKMSTNIGIYGVFGGAF